MISSSDAVNLGAHLSEMLNRFNELSAKMATQRRIIDQLVSNNSGAIQNDRIPVDDNQHELENQSPHMTHIQTTFVPPFTNPFGGTFTYPIHSLLHTYLNSILVNLTSN